MYIYVFTYRDNNDNSTRVNNDNITNPLYTVEIETTNNVTSSIDTEHIYDSVKYDNTDVKQKPKHKVPSSILQNYPKHANEDADCASIKSDELPSNESSVYCKPDSNKENTTHSKNPIPLPPKPKYANKPIATPIAKAQRYHSPTNENKSWNDENAMPKAKRTTENQYTSLDKAHRQDESNQYALPAAPQRAAYQELVGKSSRPSKYTIPRKTPNTN